MIKNLIFDFGKVLVDYEYFETLDQIFKTHEQAEEFYHLLIDGKWNENMDRGDSFEETFCKMQQIMPQYKEEIATVAQRFNDFFQFPLVLRSILKADGLHSETLGGFYILYSVVSKKAFFRFQIVFLADSFINSPIGFDDFLF